MATVVVAESPSEGELPVQTSASELVEYVLYWYATIHFIWITVSSRGAFTTDWSISATYLLVIAFFTFVLLRNYLVMHAIDTAIHRHDSRFNFLAGNERIADKFERLVRFIILLTVIVTPKDAYWWAERVVAAVVNGVSQVAQQIAGSLGMAFPHQFGPKSFVHDALPYYGAVLLILFLEFLVWDLINVTSLAKRTRAGKIILQVDLMNGEVADPQYRAMLRYFNICRKRHIEQPHEKVFFEVKYLEGKPVKMIEGGKVLKLYLTSSKFLERLFGIATALLVIWVSLAEFSSISVWFTASSAVLYAVWASRNENYIVGMAGHVRLPLSYLVSGLRPYT